MAIDMASTSLTELCIFDIIEIDVTSYFIGKQFMIFTTVVDVKHVVNILVSNIYKKGRQYFFNYTFAYECSILEYDLKGFILNQYQLVGHL